MAEREGTEQSAEAVEKPVLPPPLAKIPEEPGGPHPVAHAGDRPLHERTLSATSELRVEHIADLMRRFEWRVGKSGRELAKEWGVSDHRVRELSAIASRRIKLEVADPTYVSATVCTYLERVMQDAYKDGDRKSIIAAAKQWAFISGAVAQARQAEASMPVLPADANPEATLAQMDAARERLRKAIEDKRIADEARKAGSH